MRLEDMDCTPESVLDITKDEADRQRAEYEWAMDQARERIAAHADLVRRAETESAAALDLVKLAFRRFNQACKDGTEREREGTRDELHQACMHYNRLTGRTSAAA